MRQKQEFVPRPIPTWRYDLVDCEKLYQPLVTTVKIVAPRGSEQIATGRFYETGGRVFRIRTVFWLTAHWARVELLAA